MGIPKQEILLDKYDYDYIEDCLSEAIEHVSYYRLPLYSYEPVTEILKPPTGSFYIRLRLF